MTDEAKLKVELPGELSEKEKEITAAVEKLTKENESLIETAKSLEVSNDLELFKITFKSI